MCVTKRDVAAAVQTAESQNPENEEVPVSPRSQAEPDVLLNSSQMQTRL